MSTSPVILRETKKKGFTLIEVVLALGIVSVALLSTMGLMAVGLTTFHGATDRTIQAQITQRVVGAVRQTDFSRLSQLNDSTFYYDDQGLEVTDASAITAKRYVYSAKISVTNSTIIPSTLSAASQYLATISVNIASISSPQSPLLFTTVVSDNGS
jgi:uncharacterized protein (TIGR02598 family)